MGHLVKQPAFQGVYFPFTPRFLAVPVFTHVESEILLQPKDNEEVLGQAG